MFRGTRTSCKKSSEHVGHNAIKDMMEDMGEQVGHIRADGAKILSEALSLFRIRIDGSVLEGGDE